MPSVSFLKTKADLSRWRSEQQSPIHFVPTMGGLHKGHSALIKVASRSSSKRKPVVLVSIFVNPLQFGANEDFLTYPRDLKSDKKTATLAGASAIWAPSVEEIFPNKQSSTHSKFKALNNLQNYLCGSNRPGHFEGVVAVMERFLTLIKPTIVVLGEKDWQQLIILRNLIATLNLPIKVKGVATVRDDNGLAYSTRNLYLNESERKRANLLPYLLSKTANNFQQGKQIDIGKLRSQIKNEGLSLEYLETVDPFLLKPIKPDRKLCLLAAAVRCGQTRLIDHIFLMSRKPIVAIDGPAGAGKSTVTKIFAERMRLTYLDTGAMYRSITWMIQHQNINIEDDSEVLTVLQNSKIVFIPEQHKGQRVMINDIDITEQIRSPKVTQCVAKVSSNKLVRDYLTKQQRAMGEHGGLVAEGRDVGTAVFPKAEVKVFLTATPIERARRREKDLRKRGFSPPSLEDLKAQIIERDKIDSTREISPLIQAKDATQLITDGMSIEEVIDELINIFHSKVPDEVWPSDPN